MLQALRKAELNLWVMTFYAVFFNMLVDNGITMCLVIYLFSFFFIKRAKKKGLGHNARGSVLTEIPKTVILNKIFWPVAKALWIILVLPNFS